MTNSNLAERREVSSSTGSIVGSLFVMRNPTPFARCPTKRATCFSEVRVQVSEGFREKGPCSSSLPNSHDALPPEQHVKHARHRFVELQSWSARDDNPSLGLKTFQFLSHAPLQSNHWQIRRSRLSDRLSAVVMEENK